MSAKRKSAPKQSLPCIDLFTYSSHELAAGKLTISTVYGEDSGGGNSDNDRAWLGFHSEEILRMEAGWRIRSAAFTSSLVGILGELAGEALTLEDFKNPEVRAQLDQSPQPFQVGESGFLDSDDLLRECWEAAVDLAETFHDQSPMVKIAKKAEGGNEGSVAKILNRYGLSIYKNQPLKDSAITARPVVVRSFDAARILRERGLIKLSAPSNRLLDILVERDRKLLPESGFAALSRDWSDAELLAIHNTFGGKFLDAVAGDTDLPKVMEGAKALGAILVDLLPSRIRAASVYKFKLDTVPDAIKRLAELDGLGYLREARKDYKDKDRPDSTGWNKADIERATNAARLQFQSAEFTLNQELARKKLKAIKAGKFTADENHSYTPSHIDVRKIIVRIEKEFAAARVDAMAKGAKHGKWERRGGYQAPQDEPVDPALINWVKILDDEISERSRKEGRLTFSKFMELVADFVFLLSKVSFAFIGSTDYQRIENLYRDQPYRRFGPLLTDLAESIREIRDGKPDEESHVPPLSLPCSDLLMLDAMRKCWDDQREFQITSHVNDEKLRNAPHAGVMAQ
jgi:hypothetical protein